MKQTIGYVTTLVIAAVVASPAHAADANATATLENVVVTGSRVKRDASFESPVPMVGLDSAAINERGLTILGDVLMALPQASPTSNAQSTPSLLFNAGQSRIDLRALGSPRTLVLVDGRRHISGDFRSAAVDLSMLPASMVERVEVISGGASAVYGSEAISGVVNVKLVNRLDGATLDFQGGISQEGDGEEWRLSAGYGMPFADGRGSFVIGGEWGKIEAIHIVDRDWAFPGTRRNNTVSPQTVIPASRNIFMPTATFQLTSTRSASIDLDRSTLYVNSPACGTATVGAFCQDSWLFYSNAYRVLQGPSDRQVVRGYLDFELTDGLTAFGDFSYSHIYGQGMVAPTSSSVAARSATNPMPVFLRGDNPYLQGTSLVATQLRNEWSTHVGAFTSGNSRGVSKFFEEFGRRDSDITRESFRAVAGLQGDFDFLDRELSWETYAQYSEIEYRLTAYNQANIQRVLWATDPILSSGQIVCRDPAAQAAGCVPWNIIDGPSPEAVAWANANATMDGLASQTIGAASVESPLVELPAGSLRMAMGVEYRDEESSFVQDALSASELIISSTVRSGATFYNVIGTTQGRYHVSEAYAEVVAPILKDLPFVHYWSVEAAGRVGDYSTAGSVDQWRFQTTWAPVEDVSFRASRSKAVRAPSIPELFAPQSQNFTTAALDPCDRAQVAAIASDPARQARRITNCSSVILNYDPTAFNSNIGPSRPGLALRQGGNPNLFEETANTLSVGMIVKPRWLDGLSVSLDYWRIEIDDAISTVPINTLLSTLCYDDPKLPGDNRFCQPIRREANGAITEVLLFNQNVQLLSASGIDLALTYAQEIGVAGELQFRADATKYKYRDLQSFPGGPVTHIVGVLTSGFAVPDYKAAGTIGWTREKLGMEWQTRFQSSYGANEVDPPASRDPFYTGNYFEHDLTGSYRWSDALAFRAGIINVTNEAPPALPEVADATSMGASTFDSRGRWFYVGVKYAFAGAR